MTGTSTSKMATTTQNIRIIPNFQNMTERLVEKQVSQAKRQILQFPQKPKQHENNHINPHSNDLHRISLVGTPKNTSNEPSTTLNSDVMGKSS